MTSTASTIYSDDSLFDALAHSVRSTFRDAIGSADHRVFTTDTEGLYETYLSNLPAEHRQHHSCNCCRRFIERFGALVVIDAQGNTKPAMWNAASFVPAMYGQAIEAMASAVRRGRVTGVFVSAETEWGTTRTGEWTHFSLNPPPKMLLRRGTFGAVESAGQVMAAKREDYRTLSHGLAEFGLDVVNQALTLLEADALARSEKVLGPVRFLRDLHVARDAAAGRSQKENVVWRAVAGAPVGFCTPRSSVAGTIMEDIASGLAFDDIKARFSAKMNPLQYQRPQAAPSAGNIAVAEKLVAEMGIASALKRRFARLDDIEKLWEPKAVEKPAQVGGVFGHLQPKGAQPGFGRLDMPAQAITWEKFARTVLPNALRMEVKTGMPMNLVALVTAVHPDAPPILQWDREEARNPVSWYVYPGGSSPEQWGLRTGVWVEVTAVALQPSMWGAGSSHHASSAVLVLKDCVDTRNGGSGLFPEILRSELHKVRSTIEAFSRRAELQGREEASACGLRVGDKGNRGNPIRVTTALGAAVYCIDRWD